MHAILMPRVPAAVSAARGVAQLMRFCAAKNALSLF